MACEQDWRCQQCGKLLGRRRQGRVYIKYSKGPEYLVGYPVAAICHRCKTLNDATAPQAEAPLGTVCAEDVRID